MYFNIKNITYLKLNLRDSMIENKDKVLYPI